MSILKNRNSVIRLMVGAFLVFGCFSFESVYADEVSTIQNAPSQKPDKKPSQKPSQKPDKKPSQKPSQKPDKKPSQDKPCQDKPCQDKPSR